MTKIAELGFTASTLLDMHDEEIDHMMNTASQIFCLKLLVGEQYGIKAAVRAEQRNLDEEDSLHHGFLMFGDTTIISLDVLSQEGHKSGVSVCKKAGACYNKKPKMGHYVHCYAHHCLDEEASNVLRRAFKERGENVGAWRQACYKPLVDIAARQDWDINSIFSAHPHLSIWYVPTKLRQLCQAERSRAAAVVAATVCSSISAGGNHPPY